MCSCVYVNAYVFVYVSVQYVCSFLFLCVCMPVSVCVSIFPMSACVRSVRVHGGGREREKDKQILAYISKSKHGRAETILSICTWMSALCECILVCLHPESLRVLFLNQVCKFASKRFEN